MSESWARGLNRLADTVTRSLDPMSSTPDETPRRMSEAERQEVAEFIDHMLYALPEDGDGTLRAVLSAYADGLRGIVRELPT